MDNGQMILTFIEKLSPPMPLTSGNGYVNKKKIVEYSSIPIVIGPYIFENDIGQDM